METFVGEMETFVGEKETFAGEMEKQQVSRLQKVQDEPSFRQVSVTPSHLSQRLRKAGNELEVLPQTPRKSEDPKGTPRNA